MGTFVEKFPDGSGVTGSYSYTWTPPPMRPNLLVGEGQKDTNLLLGKTTYQDQMSGLVFCPPKSGVNAIANVIKGDVAPQCLLIGCVKDDLTATVLNPLLDLAVEHERALWLVMYQENNANHWRSPAAYRAGWMAVNGIVRSHPGSAYVTLAEKFALYAQQHGVGDWHDYWTGLADVMLWDCYSQTTYPSPTDMFGLAEAAAAEVGVAWGIGEFGTVWQKAGDPTGQGQADAHAEYIGHLDARKARVAIVWDGQGEADFTQSPPARAGHRSLTTSYARRAATMPAG
jgi:hypothetical protein